MVPSGSPQLSQIYVHHDSEHYSVDIVQGADPLISAFGSKSHDIIFAPTNLGAKMAASKPDYVFVGAIVFGNYYLVTNSENPFNLASLEGREITVFGANQTSDIMIRYILNENQVNSFITYVDSVSSAASLLIQNAANIILTAEPTLSILRNTYPDLDVIDLQEEYQLASGNTNYPQAGVFVKSTMDKNTVETFLIDLEASVELVKQDPSAASIIANTLLYGYEDGILESAIPNSNLDFVRALDCKEELEGYFSIILDLSPALIGGKLPEQAFYYQP